MCEGCIGRCISMKPQKSKKGFTLIELIVVIAIMGILMAIIIPSWNYYVRRSREREAAAQSKVVFNAAQIEATRLSVKERPIVNQLSDPTLDSVKRTELEAKLFMGTGDFYYYWNSETQTGEKVTDANLPDGSASALDNAAFGRAINNVTGGEGVYKVYVSNYNVQSVVYCELETGRYKGTYPVIMEDLSNATREEIRGNAMLSVDMKKLVLTP